MPAQVGESILLPTLRQNLRLLTASPDEEGEPRWQIFDPLSNKFYSLSRTAFYLFHEWRHARNDKDLCALMAKRGVEVSPDELTFFMRFLELNHLIETHSDAALSNLEQNVIKRKKNLIMWLLHNYLFIKIPLFRPDIFLTRVFPQIKFLFKLRLHFTAIMLGILGLVMVLRQWETFTHTLQNSFNVSSISYYIGALVIVKTAHELGHAFVAKRYGCRVSSMGIAFLLMTPILFTDTTDAWRLRSRFQRLSIVTAGIRVEIYIACVATFLWGIIPDGSVRSILFFVATTSWVSSLLINTSPFMRFDGYYALSDYLGMENLQQRSFLVGRWFLREHLFKFGLIPPEPLNRKKCLLMVAYAWGTWVYRFFLFLGIAVLVYYFTFKLLGIILFFIEIMWFVLLPIIKEIGVWISLRKKMSLNRTSVLTILFFLLFVCVLTVPWKSHVSVPAVVTFERYQTYYSSEASQVISFQMTPNKKVAKNELLILLESPDIEQHIRLTQVSLDALTTRWQRANSGATSIELQLTLQAQIAREQSRLKSLLDRREKLAIRAEFSGYIGEWASFSRGDYVNEKEPLAILYDDQSGIVKAYVRSHIIPLLKMGTYGTFIGDDGEPLASRLVIDKVIPTATKNLHYLGLSSIHNGPIATQKLNDLIIPEEAIYEIQLRLEDNISLKRQHYGTVTLDIESTSILLNGLRYVYGVFIRESGF